MNIYLLYTCDQHKSKGSMVLRGVFTEANYHKIEQAKIDLADNNVIANEETETYVTQTYDGQCYTNGRYIS